MSRCSRNKGQPKRSAEMENVVTFVGEKRGGGQVIWPFSSSSLTTDGNVSRDPPCTWFGSGVRKTDGTGDSGSGMAWGGSGLRKGEGASNEAGNAGFGSSKGGNSGVVVLKSGVLVAWSITIAFLARPGSGRVGD